MNNKIVWLILSCLIALILVVASCGAAVENGEGVVTPTGEEEGVVEDAGEEEGEEEGVVEEVVEEEEGVVEETVEDVEEPLEEEQPPEEEEEEVPPEEIEMEIISAAFQNGETIPTQYTCSGQDISPALNWSGVPEGTQSFALIVDDPDAPGGTFTHWVIFNIPADTIELGEAIPTSSELPSGALQGRNSFGRIGYDGPCPPPGTPHHYHFVLYALGRALDLPAGASNVQVLNAMQDHILAQAELVGIYKR